ncbi:MAG: aminotransferase class III-fold pyridoxal phosphate-dependent enzyme, partial [Myxococcota bacterium]
LIFDEVFTGFRLAPGGAQAFFGVHADLVVYGKTLGGGLPVGVVCGRADLMKRFRDDRPADLCFARGTFNGLPIVMGTMNAFLRALDTDAVRATYTGLEARWDARRTRLNDALGAISAPLRLDGLISVWTTRVERPSRFNWMFRFYLEDAGLMVPWTGTGRLVFPHSLDDADFDILVERFVGAAQGMLADGWWHPVEGLTHRRIARQWVWETARAALGRRPWSPA